MQKTLFIFYVLLTTLNLLGPFQQTVFAQTGNPDQDEQLRRDAENLSRITKADQEEAKERYDRKHSNTGGGSGDMFDIPMLFFGLVILVVGFKFYEENGSVGQNSLWLFIIALGIFMCFLAIWPIALIALVIAFVCLLFYGLRGLSAACFKTSGNGNYVKDDNYVRNLKDFEKCRLNQWKQQHEKFGYTLPPRPAFPTEDSNSTIYSTKVDASSEISNPTGDETTESHTVTQPKNDVEFSCNKCGQQLKVSFRSLDATIRCPTCGNLHANLSQQVAPQLQKFHPFKKHWFSGDVHFQCHNCGQNLVVDRGRISGITDTMPCPICKHTIAIGFLG